MSNKKTNFEELYFQILKDINDEFRENLKELSARLDRDYRRLNALEGKCEEFDKKLEALKPTQDKGQLIRLAIIALIIFLIIIATVVGAKLPNISL